jgi:hypothetical protein
MKIQALARDLENYSKDAPCKLPNKFVVGGIISKLPPSWKDFATSLKHKRQKFAVVDLIGTLDVEEKAREKNKSHGKGIAGSSSANLVQEKNHNAFKKRTSRIRINQRLSRRLSSSRKSRQLGGATAVVARNTSLQSVRNARIRKMARVPTWLLVKLVERRGTVIFYLQFFQYVIHLIGGLTLVLIFMFVLIFPCFPLTRWAEFPPC